MGTLQYAAAHLHTPLFVVLGHEGCGAVDATIAHKYAGVAQKSRIEFLLREILATVPSRFPPRPSARRSSVRRTHLSGDNERRRV